RPGALPAPAAGASDRPRRNAPAPTPTTSPTPVPTPRAPSISTITDRSLKISGKDFVGGTITVASKTFRKTTSSKKGYWAITLKKALVSGTKVTATVKHDGMVSVTTVRYVIPATPVVYKLKANSIYVKGTATKSAMVYAKIKTKIYVAKASPKTGVFAIKIPKIKKGTIVIVYAKAGGRNSASKTVKAV
ncbi:MAG: hypothetical protein WCL54_09215, partial [Clostridia bacterium]